MPETKDAASILSSALFKSSVEQSAVVVTAKGAAAVDLAVLKLLAKESYTGIILCIDRPASFYSKLMESGGADPKCMRFINIGFKETGDNITTLGENAGDLTFIKIELVRTAQQMRMKGPDAKLFVLNDAIATIMLYSDEDVVGRFLHDLNNKFRELNVYVVTIIEPDEKIGSLVKKLADVVVNLD